MNTALSLIDTIDNQGIMATMKKISEFQAVVQNTLKSGHDFDVIPGTNKPTLLKPGAEKINMMFGINPEYDFLQCIEDYEKEFFSYNMKCTLYKNGSPVAQGVGSCNSKEKKYRWLNVREDEIPHGVDKANLQPVTDKYGKVKYKIDNPDVCSLVNTILKMAKKRAFIDATLQVAALSEIFSQDLDEMKDFLDKEQSDNMTVEESAKMKIKFGKHKGKTLGEIFKSDYDYVTWVMEKGTDAMLKKAFGMMIDAAKQHKENKHKPAEEQPQPPTESVDYTGTPFGTEPEE